MRRRYKLPKDFVNKHGRTARVEVFLTADDLRQLEVIRQNFGGEKMELSKLLRCCFYSGLSEIVRMRQERFDAALERNIEGVTP